MAAISKGLPPPPEWFARHFGERPEVDTGRVEDFGAEERDGSTAVAEG